MGYNKIEVKAMKEKLINLSKRTIQHMITKEANSWPPECTTILFHQPKRPIERLTSTKDKKA